MNGGWYQCSWQDLARGDHIQVFEPGHIGMQGPEESWVVDGFLPDGQGVFGTKVEAF